MSQTIANFYINTFNLDLILSLVHTYYYINIYWYMHVIILWTWMILLWVWFETRNYRIYYSCCCFCLVMLSYNNTFTKSLLLNSKQTICIVHIRIINYVCLLKYDCDTWMKKNKTEYFIYKMFEFTIVHEVWLLYKKGYDIDFRVDMCFY